MALEGAIDGADAVQPRHVAVEITQARAADGAREASGGGTSKTIRAPAAPATGGAPSAAADEDALPETLACLVCLEEDTRADGGMLRDICACKTTGVHLVCLEKLVNSRRRRRLSFEERMACPVCTRSFTVPHERTLLAHAVGGSGARPNRRGVTRTVGTAVAASFLLSFSARVLTTAVGRQLLLIFFIFVGFSYLFFIIYGGGRCRPRARPAEAEPRRDPDELDDEQFYAQVVLAHAAEMDKYRLEGEAPNSHRIVVHIGRTCATATRPAEYWRTTSAAQ